MTILLKLKGIVVHCYSIYVSELKIGKAQHFLMPCLCLEEAKGMLKLLNDWRLTNQEKYLKNKKILKKDYKDRITFSEHDHCEFCMEKFSENELDINSGYCTEDNYYWICEECFFDFKEFFRWEVME